MRFQERMHLEKFRLSNSKWPPIGHYSLSHGRLAAILNLVELNFFKMHSPLKPYNLFYSNGVDILSGFHDIRQYQACQGE